MRIALARLTPFRLRLRAPLRTARGRIRARDGVLLELASDAGVSGFGTSMPLAGFGLEDLAASELALEDLARAALGRDADAPGAALDALECRAREAPCARAALDAALHDLAARACGERVGALLSGGGCRPRERVAVCALVAGDAPGAAAASARDCVARGFRTLKLKVGARGIAADASRVAAVRRAVGPGVKLRLDANGAWTESDAGRALERFAAFDVEFVEQPVAASDRDALARVRAASPLLVAADEAVRDLASAAELLSRGAADLLVLKPAAVGGLRAAQRIAGQARQSRVEVVVTSLLDSVLGVAAALQLAAALPASPRAAGLATGALLADDLAPPLVPKDGELELPSAPGLGVAPDRVSLERCARGATREIRP